MNTTEKNKINSNTPAVCIDADGTYGDMATVWYAGTVAQCRASGKKGGLRVLVGSGKKKGDQIMRGPLANMIDAGIWSIA